MEFNQNRPMDDLYFSAYGAGWVEVAGVRYFVPILLNFTAVQPLIQKDFYAVSEIDFAPALAALPELILIGCGEKQGFLHPKIVAQLLTARIGVEVMSTPALCRTYTILKDEGRKVWAWVWL